MIGGKNITPAIGGAGSALSFDPSKIAGAPLARSAMPPSGSVWQPGIGAPSPTSPAAPAQSSLLWPSAGSGSSVPAGSAYANMLASAQANPTTAATAQQPAPVYRPSFTLPGAPAAAAQPDPQQQLLEALRGMFGGGG